jgi:adenylate cyclase
MQKAVLFFIVILFSFNAKCQRTSNLIIDSLKHLLSKTREDTAKVDILLSISKIARCDDTLVSVTAAKNALLIAKNIKWQKGEMLAYMRVGEISEDCHIDYKRAFSNYLSGLQIAKKIGDSISESYIYGSMGNIYQHNNKYDSSLLCYKKSIQLNRDPWFQTSPLANSGVVYNTLGDYQHALESYEHALKLTQELLSSANANKNNSSKGDSLAIVGLLLSIGDIYVSMSQYDNALNNYNTALKNSRSLKKKYTEIWALTEIAKVYKIRKDFSLAIHTFEESLSASDSLHDNDIKPIILNELGNVYLETGNLTNAINYSKQSLTIVEESNDQQQLPKTYTTLGKINTKLNNYKEATNYLSKAISICKQTGALDVEKEAWSALSNAYEQMHQTDKAFDAYRHYITLRDSVYNVDKAKEMVRMDLQSGFDRKQLTDSMKQNEAKKILNLKFQKQRAYTYSGFGGLVLVLMLTFFIFRNYSQQKKANKIISKANTTIQSEKQVSETLLLNILPENVAQELKTSGKVHAKLFDDVTVLFTDFVNFTEAGERFTPQQLVAELDECFQAFDQIISKYNIEKIKTVGDAYLAVSGLPQANPDHASDMVSAAIEIRDFMADRKQKLGDLTFGMRVGINSGSVVAGIVGLKKFAYDIWGDTVNTASRMEQNSEPGKINISESTYILLKGQFNCLYRGKVQAKNKGMIDMYFVG